MRPVRALFPFGNPKSEQEPGEGAQSGLLKAQFAGHGTDLDEAARLEGPASVQLFYIVGKGYAGLDNGGVFENLAKRTEATKSLELEDKDLG